MESTGKAGSHRDPIEFSAGSLGKAKTAAEDMGAKLVREFEHVEALQQKLREEHGIEVARVRFDHPVTQAAWLAFSKHDAGPPMMPTEDELVRRTTPA